MKFPLPSATLPTLELSREQKRATEDAADALVKESLKKYHEHLTVHNGVVDEKRYKQIKQRENVCVYRERKPIFAFSDESANIPSEPLKDSSKNTDLETVVPMLTFGSFQGNVDDAIYGTLSPSTEAMQLKTAYNDDDMTDWALLASIITPSVQNPFRELSLKWFIKDPLLLVGAVMRPRDAVYIDSIGFAVTPTGERIGYHLFHLVDIPEIPELTKLQIVRAKFSICEFFRQRKPDCVEVFAWCMVNPKGGVSASLAALTAAKATVTVSKQVHCAEMKKITRMVVSAGNQCSETLGAESLLSSSPPRFSRHSGRDASRSSLSRSSSVSLPSASQQCAMCEQRIGGGFSFIRSKEKSCRICSERVCSRCRVYKTLYLSMQTEKQLARVEMALCTRCIQETITASSVRFAVLDAIAAEGQHVDYSVALVPEGKTAGYSENLP